MKAIPLFLAPGLIAVFAGCASIAVQESRGPIREDAHLAVAHVSPSQVDSLPQPQRLVPPHLQDTIPGPGLHGYAIVEFVVDPGGMPREVQWVEASDLLFADLATTAVADSRYLPARKGGRAVATVMKQRWEINGNKLAVFVYPPNSTPGAPVPDLRVTNYAESGVNPKPPTYLPGGPLP